MKINNKNILFHLYKIFKTPYYVTDMAGNVIHLPKPECNLTILQINVGPGRVGRSKVCFWKALHSHTVNLTDKT